MRLLKHPRQLLTVLGVVFVFVISMLYGCTDSVNDVKEIKLHARRASVQPLFYIPGLKVSFTNPLSEAVEITADYIEKLFKERVLTREDLEKWLKEKGLRNEDLNKWLEGKDLTRKALSELMDKKIKDAIKQELEQQGEGRYNTVLTVVEEWGFESPSKTHIPLGTLCPEWARFPERVLVVYKTKKVDIAVWEKEYEKDVLSIAETANVSPSGAKAIITNLRSQGYTISKEEVDVEAEVRLLWFDDGWKDNYPRELSWKVSVEGTKANIIVGYDPRGILLVKPIPDDKKVYVKAGYIDLKYEFKPKAVDVETLEKSVQFLKEQIKDKEEVIKEKDEQNKEELAKQKEEMEALLEQKQKELEEKEEELRKEKKEPQRDISRVTWLDVKYGLVKIEQFWMIGGGTGTFLGNMKVREGFAGYQSDQFVHTHGIVGTEKAVILTNAHVAEMAIKYEIWVSEDKEIMWVVFPGHPFIRFTQDSDMYGSPAQILCYDGKPISSNDYDTAIMVTTKIPEYEQHKALLGNSDSVEQGDKVVMVGNPSLLQKFTSEGIVSNKDYSLLKMAIPIMHEVPQSVLNLFTNSTFWFDVVLGYGGTSGSGVWALEGSEVGKIVAIHNLGISKPLSIAVATAEGKAFNPSTLDFDVDELEAVVKEGQVNPSALIRATAEKYAKLLFQDYPYETAKFQFSFDKMVEENPTFGEFMTYSGRHIELTGMNIGVPINKVKTFLQERGLDPKHFGWEGTDKAYWEK